MLDELFGDLAHRGYTLLGPTIRDGAIVHAELASGSHLPIGWTETQDAGTFRLRERNGAAPFRYAVGPDSWKRYLFPPRLTLRRAQCDGNGGFHIEATGSELPALALIGVIEGDVAASVDTETVLNGDAHDAVQINTGGGCHLEADMIEQAFDSLDLDALDVVVIENVGNLICPTSWDLGEAYKVCLASTPEGSDKPIKYPELFAVSDVVVLNKADLVELLEFDRTRFDEALRALNADVTVFDVSSRTGEGVDTWVDWLITQANMDRA